MDLLGWISICQSTSKFGNSFLKVKKKMPESEIDKTNLGHQIRYFGKSFIVDQLNFVWIIEICHKSQ